MGTGEAGDSAGDGEGSAAACTPELGAIDVVHMAAVLTDHTLRAFDDRK